MSQPLFTAENLWAAYRIDPVLQDINWQWLPGQQWAIIGGNGAGKSALADALQGQLKPQRGSCQWQPGLDPKHDIRQLGFEQHRQLIRRDNRFDNSNEREDAYDVGTTVAQYILQGDPVSDAFTELCQRCGISHILDHGIRYISTGESRKTLLVEALLHRPRILVIDNPYEGLDQQSQQDFQKLLDELLQSSLAIVLLLQDPEQTPNGISHVMQLEFGHITVAGEREQVMPQLMVERFTDLKAELPPALPRHYTIANDKPLLELNHVDVSFHDQAVLRDINWRFEPSQHCHISGPNGAGKSTLLNLLCGENHKAYGQDIWLFGQRRGSGETLWDIKAKFGMVSTQLQLGHVKRMRVAEVVASGLYDTIGLYEDCSGKQRNIALAWLRYAGLEELAKTPFERLSFGQQRLALLARAMVKSPPILILDEPCLGLDQHHRQHILALVDAIAASGRSQILFVSHIDSEVPRCINQRLQLVTHADGGYTAAVS